MGESSTLTDVTRLDVTKWRDKLRRLHPRWASSATSKGLSLDELLSRYGQGPETLSDKTLSRHMSAPHNLFEWAIETGHFDGANPVSVSGSNGKKIEKRYRRGTFDDDEVAKIFGDLSFATRPNRHEHGNALPWITLLGAFSGARLEEVCGLHSGDLKQEDGIWFMDLKETDRQLKTLSAYRRVPLHSEVLAFGFLGYMQSCDDGWLFPSLGEPNKDGRRGTYLGKVFSRHCRKLGIEKPLLGFHYWRKTVATKLENAKVPELETARLIGHRIKTMSYGLYSGGLDLENLSRVVEKIKYPKLKLSHLHSPELPK
jgi:integrase